MIIVMFSLSKSSVIKMYVGVFNFFRFKSVFKKLFFRGDRNRVTVQPYK